MLVSAVSLCDNINCIKNEVQPFRYNKQNDSVTDTSFNALSPSFINKNSTERAKLRQMYNNINEWQLFCHDRILGEKLDIIA